MEIERFEVPGLAHYSYMLTSGAEAVVIDPRRDVEEYVSKGKFTYILETQRSWLEAGFEHSRVPQVPVCEVAAESVRKPLLLDVRNDEEWQAGHIAGAIHMPAGDIPGEIDANAPVYTICSTGYRASVAASLLLRAGFRHVINVSGGMTAWTARQLPVTSTAAKHAGG